MSATTTSSPVERGQTFYGPDVTIDTAAYKDVQIEGTKVVFDDTGPDDKTKLRSGEKIEGRIMRNTSGGTLYAKYAVSPVEGSERERLGNTFTTACPLAGIIDDQLGSNGVRNGDMCIVITKGTCGYYTPTAAPTTAIGDLLYAKDDDGGALTRHAKALTFTATQTTDGTMGKILKNSIGRALSSSTADETSTARLIDINVQV